MMFSAKATATHRGLWRRSRSTLFAAFVVALIGLGQSGAAVFGADPVPATSPAEPSGPLTPDQQRVENVIAAARQYLGVPYRIGSEGPSLFDCSGLVFRAFSDVGLVDRIGGARLRAAGYMRYFASRGLMTRDETQARRGDLVIYDNGSHMGIYLGDGRTISALVNPFGVTVHSLHGLDLPVTGFLRPDWSGDGDVPPFVPVDNLPDVPEAPATLVPGADWMPTLDPALSAPAAREGKEHADMRTLNSRTFENKDGTFTTEFHAQPIFYQPAGTTDPKDLKPTDLTFLADRDTGNASVATSTVAVTTRAADDPAGFVTAAAADRSVSLGLASDARMSDSTAAPQIVDGGRVVDFFDFQPQAVGLRVMAQTDGFKAFLVLNKTPDRTRFSFVLNAPGLLPVVADDGSILLTDEGGAIVGRIPRPMFLDSSDINGDGGGVFTAATTLSVDTSGDAPVITIAIDPSYLEEAVMPGYVDLSLTGFPRAASSADVAFASSAHPNASLYGFQRPESAGFDELWLGHQPSSRNDNEVYVRFDGLSNLLGTVDVASASLELLPYLQQTYDGLTAVHRVTADWSPDSIAWDNRPAVDAVDGMSVTTAAGAWSALDVSNYVSDVLSRGQADYGLVLSGDESSSATWKRLAASDAGDNAEFGPRLVVTWSGLRPSGAAIAPAYDASRSTTLSWSNPLLVTDQTRFQVEISHDDFTTVDLASGAVKGKDGKQSKWTLPADAPIGSGTYSWRVRIMFGADGKWTDWSSPGTFEVAGQSTSTAQPRNAIDPALE